MLSQQQSPSLISKQQNRAEALTSFNSKALLVSNPPDYEKSTPKLGTGLNALLYEKEVVIQKLRADNASLKDKIAKFSHALDISLTNK